jgi:methionine synthase II (cobalamin-independent)
LVRHDASEQSVIDATHVVVDAQRQLGIDLSIDGELYRFAVHHPDTNGMIDYFIRPLDGVGSKAGCGDQQAFAAQRRCHSAPNPSPDNLTATARSSGGRRTTEFC